MDSVNQSSNPEHTSGTMNIMDIINTISEINKLDMARQETLIEYYNSKEPDTTMNEIENIIEMERNKLDELSKQLAVEKAEAEKLSEKSAHLSVEQAVRNREAAIEKIRSHNSALYRFQNEMTQLLGKTEDNLKKLGDKKNEVEELSKCQEHFTNAKDALQSHNQAIEGLDKNLQILTAYLR